MHERNREISFPHLSGQPLDLLLLVAEDYCLGYCQGVVQITERLKLEILFLN